MYVRMYTVHETHFICRRIENNVYNYFTQIKLALEGTEWNTSSKNDEVMNLLLWSSQSMYVCKEGL